MAKIASFKDLIADMFYDDLYKALGDYVEDEPGKLGCRSYTIQDPDEATLCDMSVKLLNITGAPGSSLNFDVIVSAEMEIAETVRRNREVDEAEQWFRISCSCDTAHGIQGIQIGRICVYNNQRQSKIGQLSDYLVPIIYKENLDAEATKFLEQYYPEALKTPMALPVDDLAQRMWLTVQQAHITKTCSVFGQVFFGDSTVECYDEEAHCYRSLDVKEGTILVDPNVFFMYSVGSMNNTIVHECVHWGLHRRFFELEKLYNSEARSIVCQVKEGAHPEANRTPLEWMEWQATHLAPRILMPEAMTRLKIEELFTKNRALLPDGSPSEIMESVVFELADFFGVSKLSAKIRMIDLGYKEAIGVFTYIDDHYIASYSFEAAAMQKNQTFAISSTDAAFNYATKPDFRKLLDSGKYVYVDSHFCINDTKYVRINDAGVAQLTDYAQQHIDECCLVFDVHQNKNLDYGVLHYTECSLFRDAVTYATAEPSYSTNAQNQGVDSRASTSLQMGQQAKAILAIKRSLPAEFSETLVAHMKRLGVSVETLADKSRVETKTIQRLRNNEEQNTKLPTVIALCVGLQLDPILCDDMVDKAGFRFKNTEEHILYQLILRTMTSASIFECNEVMTSNGYKPLVKEE